MKKRRGQGLVEFAMILPLFLLLMMGIVEFSHAFIVYTGLFNAAREGTRYGMVNALDYAGIENAAQEKMLLVAPDQVDLTVAYDRGPGTGDVFTDPGQIRIGDRVLVHVAHDLPTLTPMIRPFASSFHIESRAARTIVSRGAVHPFHPGTGGGSGGGDDGGDGDGATDPGDGGEEPASPSLAVSATANPETIYSGTSVDFTYTVTNTGNVELDWVVITDSFGNTLSIGALAIGATVVTGVTEPVNTTTTNQVEAAASSSGGDTISNASVDVTFIGPALDLAVQVSPQTVGRDEPVTFTYTVENTGDADLSGVTVTDSLGSSLATVALAPGAGYSWEVVYQPQETTTNDVTASGTDPLGGTVSDSESIIVYVVLSPIAIHKPLEEGQTVVTGTAEPGETVQIRDIYSETFPSPAAGTTTVAGDGSFEFAGLPPLVGGHVIVVDGYGEYDSAFVENLEPIVVSKPLCHGETNVYGVGAPERRVELLITDTGHRETASTDGQGAFDFALPTDQFLSIGETVTVSGYEGSGVVQDTTVVSSCTSEAYITLTPRCGGPTDTMSILVRGYNWEYKTPGDGYSVIEWDGFVVDEVEGQPTEWEKEIAVAVTEGTHTVRAMTKLGYSESTATFVSPCPAPNLVVPNIKLLTTEPISTYQPLDFSVTVANIGTRPVNNVFWVDLYATTPPTPTTTIGWGAVSSLGAGNSTTITITVQSGFEVTGTYQIWALADSQDDVTELDETDNASEPISVTVSLEGTEPVTHTTTATGTIQGETWVSLTGVPVPHARATVECRDADGNLVASTISDADAQYTLTGLPAGTYTLTGEAWIDGKRYSDAYQIELLEGETLTQFIIMYED